MGTVQKIKREVQDIERIAGRAGADTIRLWESYRDQAYMWRALAMIQIPTTFVAIAAALIMYFFADTVIEVPERPQPGNYSVKQLPDSEFTSVATEVVNLIGSYQPATARRQFSTARKYLWEPALTLFEEKMMKDELRTVEETGRSQIFYVDPNQTKITRFPEQDKVEVRVQGNRLKLIGDKPLPADYLAYYITMTTIPRNEHNEYGIVVIDVKLRKLEQTNELQLEDRKQAVQEVKAAKQADEARRKGQ
ncbi:hypothetical protein JNK13_10385 [bacterium]|nr:hypothetical protein [bacterium]